MVSTVHLFPLGTVVVTPAARISCAQNETNVDTLLARHASGDWGTIAPHERRWNVEAVETGGTIMSVYRLADHSIIWVMTTSDPTATTILVPGDDDGSAAADPS